MKFLSTILSASFSLIALGSVQAKAHPTQGILPGPSPNKQLVKIALLLDTSNSMDGLIDQAKAQLWKVVNEFSHARCGNNGRPALKIALYEYGNDGLGAEQGHIRQVMGFSGDLDEISRNLFALTTNGGKEYCGAVISTALEQLEWGKNADDLKMIFIAGNEPFDQGKLDYRDAGFQAQEQGVIVNTIFCGDHGQGIRGLWKDGAQITGGEYTSIDHNRRVVYVDTPYDELIIRLNDKLNNTYIAYGLLGREKKAVQLVQDHNAMELEQAVAVQRTLSKSSRLYNNSRWDLVDALEEDSTLISKMDPKGLPAFLRDRSTPEIRAYVEGMRLQREKIQKDIQEANALREAYLTENQVNQSGELEQALMGAIRSQAATKNFSWD